MTESDLLAEVLRLCEQYGLHSHHCYDSRKCAGSGVPDLLICGTEVIHVELKDDWGTLSPEQVAWKWSLVAAGARHLVWRPAQLHSGVIESTLVSIAPHYAKAA